MNPSDNPSDASFEEFRRSRKRGQLMGAMNQPGTGRNALKEIESHERLEVLQHRLQREMTEFFGEATRLAASILHSLKQEKAQELSEQVYAEMEGFLRESARKAELLVTKLRETAARNGLAVADLETSLTNLTPKDLDRFRAAGTANLADKHMGQDPFKTPTTPTVPPPPPKEPTTEEEVARALRILQTRGILDDDTITRLQRRAPK
jgi:uncharacterized membrane protein YccC